jgi:orotidine-5'-phosphate decarboxylase
MYNHAKAAKEMAMNFSDKLAQAIRKNGNPTVMGLDPMLSYIPASLRAQVAKHAPDASAAVGESLFAFNAALIDATADIIPMIKPQLAYYEQYGIAGLQAFERTCRYAREKGMLVLADGKRNDIGSTAQAYANAYLGETDLDDGTAGAVFGVDALTVNAYLGEDGIKPFMTSCDAFGKGIFVLVKTSNPSSGQLQDLPLADGRTVYEMMADLVSAWGAPRVGACGYASVGAVVGATYPEQLAALRKRMPKTWILVPGYGAQGGKAEDVAKAFDADGLGAVVNASRSLMCAWQKDAWRTTHGEADFAQATREEAIRMRDAIKAATGN